MPFSIFASGLEEGGTAPFEAFALFGSLSGEEEEPVWLQAATERQRESMQKTEIVRESSLLIVLPVLRLIGSG